MFDKVLQIGINYKNTASELRGCIQDVNNLNEFLKKDLGASKAEFKILTEEQTDKTLLPTKANIINAFKWLITGATSTTKLFIHYSGHGGYTRDKNGDEADGRDETICPLDGEIIDDDIRKYLVDTLPEGCELWGIFDCCHSGTVMDLRYSYKVDIDKKGNLSYIIKPEGNYKNSKCKVYIFSGCKDDQTSADAYINSKFQGAMTWSFIKSCRSLKKAGHRFKFKELMKPLLVNLKRGGYDQIPQITSGQWTDLNSEMWQIL